MSSSSPRRARLYRWFGGLLAAAALVSTPAMAADGAEVGFEPTPVAVIPPLAYGGVVPVEVRFDGSGSYCLELCSLVAWEWSFGDGTTASGAVVNHTYTRSGLFTVTLSVTSDNGVTRTASTMVNAFAATQARMTVTPTRGMVPLTVAVDGTGSVTNWDRTLSYAWAFGDGATGTGATTSHEYTTPGVFQVGLTVTDSQGGGQSVGEYVYVQDPMAPPSRVRSTSPRAHVVIVRWTNRMVGVDRLTVERCVGPRCKRFEPVYTAGGTTTMFTDKGLRSGSTFRYRIVVTDYLGNTGTSAITTVQVL